MSTSSKHILYISGDKKFDSNFSDLIQSFQYSFSSVELHDQSILKVIQNEKPDLLIIHNCYHEKGDGISLYKEVSGDQAIPVIFVMDVIDDVEMSAAREVNSSGYIFSNYDQNQIRLSLELAFDKIEAIKRLKANESRFKLFFNYNPLMLFVLNEVGVILDINDYSVRQLGYPREELIGNSVINIFVESDRPKIDEQMTKLSKGKEEKRTWEIRKVCKDGRIIWVNEIARKMEWFDGSQIILVACEDITERKESEEKYLEILEHSTNLFYSHTVDHQITYISSQSRKFFDCEPEEALIKWTEFATDNPINEVGVEITKKAIETGIKQDAYELELKSKTGRILWVEVNEAPVVKNGKTVGIVGSLTDITESKKATLELKTSEEKYKNLIDQSNDVIYLLYKGKFEVINKKFTELMGYTLDDVNKPGFDFMELIAPNSRPLIEERVSKSMRGEKSSPIYEFVAITKSGKEIECEASVTYIPYGDGLATQGILRDIRDRKKMEQALKESEERFRSLFENATVGIYRSTPSGKVILANPKLKDMMGFNTLDEVENYNTKDGYVDKKDKARFDEIMQNEGIIYGYESVWKRMDGTEITIRESSRAINDDEGNIIFYEGIVEDITDQILARKALIDAKERAERSDKIKSDFLAQISHEIRTPINAILSFSDLIKMEISDNLDEEVRQSFTIIDSAGKRIIRTVDSILNMSELQSGVYEANLKFLDLYDEILRGLISEYRSFAEEKKLLFNSINEAFSTKVYVDEYSTSQIFRNLIDNAFKYTNKGKVEISIQDKSEKMLQVIVSDTGIGIAPDYLPLIFEPFSQEDQGYTRQYEGNGLGLALVKKYCTINRIKIKVDSTKNLGTTFTLDIPRNRLESRK